MKRRKAVRSRSFLGLTRMFLALNEEKKSGSKKMGRVGLMLVLGQTELIVARCYFFCFLRLFFYLFLLSAVCNK